MSHRTLSPSCDLLYKPSFTSEERPVTPHHPSLYSLAAKRVSVLQRKMQPEQQYYQPRGGQMDHPREAKNESYPCRAAPRRLAATRSGLFSIATLPCGWQNTRTACGQTG